MTDSYVAEPGTETTQRRVDLLSVVDEKLSPVTIEQSVYLDGDAWSETLRLRGEVSKAKADADGLRSDAPRLQAELDQLETRLRNSELRFTFRQLSRLAGEELVAAHQDGNTDPDMPWNEHTYPQALVVAACIRVDGVYSADSVTAEEVAGLWSRLGQQQTDDLFRAAWNVQREAPRPFGFAASEQTPGSGQKSSTSAS